VVGVRPATNALSIASRVASTPPIPPAASTEADRLRIERSIECGVDRRENLGDRGAIRPADDHTATDESAIAFDALCDAGDLSVPRSECRPGQNDRSGSPRDIVAPVSRSASASVAVVRR